MHCNAKHVAMLLVCHGTCIENVTMDQSEIQISRSMIVMLVGHVGSGVVGCVGHVGLVVVEWVGWVSGSGVGGSCWVSGCGVGGVG